MFEGTVNPNESSSRKILRDDLDDFLEVPVTPAEVQTKADFYSRVQPWLSQALMQVGYPLTDIDGRLSQAFNGPDFFNRDPETVASDVNQIIKDLAVEAQAFLQTDTATPEVSLPTVESNTPVAEVKPLEKLILKNPIQEPVLEKPPVNSANLIPEMPVIAANEPIVLETVEGLEEVSSEKFDAAREYQIKLDALNAQPFNREAYVEYVFDLHTGLRQKYDEVITSARTHLKRFDGFNPQSTAEKEALQFLSSLQGHYAKMQKADTEIGVIRAELTNSLNYTDAKTNEITVKTSTQNYLDATKKLFANISKLEGLIEVVKSEERPSVAEIYRTQFEKMRTEGNQVLQSLPANHPLYERLKTSIEVDLQKIIEQASVENGGDKAVLENSSHFMARRDQIKELIGFVKKEQEYQDFFERARVRVQKLEAQFENIPQSDTAASIKQSLAENIVKIKEALAETAPQIATVGVLDMLRVKKDTIQGLLLESGELLTSLPASETVLAEPGTTGILSDEEVIARIENSIRGKEIIEAQERYHERAQLLPLFNEWTQAVRRRDLRALESRTNLERIKNSAAKIPRSKIGKVAAVVLAFLATTETANQSTNTNVLNGSVMSGINVPSDVINSNAINEYLRSDVTKNPFEISPIVITELAEAPVVDVSAPVLKTQPAIEETVPGVILPDMLSSARSEAQDSPLEIFSDDADSVPADPGIVFNPNQVESKKLGKYLINYGDKFWDINEGQTLAGKLPVMSQINPYFKQALIDRVRDKINSDSKERALIGGFGKDPSRAFADQLVTGEYMDLDALNKLVTSIAADYGYLKMNI